MQSYDFLAATLATIAYRDGFPDGLSGMLGVAFTLRNRISAGWHGGNWTELFNAHQNYAAYPEPTITDFPDPRVCSVSELLRQIDAIFKGTAEDTITRPRESVHDHFQIGARPQVALYYARLHEPMREEFRQNICQNHERHSLIAKVGTLSFFS
jgi:hypothetical protein